MRPKTWSTTWRSNLTWNVWLADNQSSHSLRHPSLLLHAHAKANFESSTLHGIFGPAKKDQGISPFQRSSWISKYISWKAPHLLFPHPFSTLPVSIIASISVSPSMADKLQSSVQGATSQAQAAASEGSQKWDAMSEEQKKKAFDSLPEDQKKGMSYTEWIKQGYHKQYENWMPWIEDLYLRWFTNDNKASYATKGKCASPRWATHSSTPRTHPRKTPCI